MIKESKNIIIDIGGYIITKIQFDGPETDIRFINDWQNINKNMITFIDLYQLKQWRDDLNKVIDRIENP